MNKKVSDSIVDVIRDCYSYQGMEILDIAKKLNLSDTTIRNVIEREAMCNQQELMKLKEKTIITKEERQAKRLNNLSQNKDISQEELFSLAKKSIEKKLIFNEMKELIQNEEEKLFILNLFEQYNINTNDFSQKGQFNTLVIHKIIVKRMITALNKDYKNLPPMHLIEQLSKMTTKIVELEEKLFNSINPKENKIEDTNNSFFDELSFTRHIERNWVNYFINKEKLYIDKKPTPVDLIFTYGKTFYFVEIKYKKLESGFWNSLKILKYCDIGRRDKNFEGKIIEPLVMFPQELLDDSKKEKLNHNNIGWITFDDTNINGLQFIEKTYLKKEIK